MQKDFGLCGVSRSPYAYKIRMRPHPHPASSYGPPSTCQYPSILLWCRPSSSRILHTGSRTFSPRRRKGLDCVPARRREKCRGRRGRSGVRILGRVEWRRRAFDCVFPSMRRVQTHSESRGAHSDLSQRGPHYMPLSD